MKMLLVKFPFIQAFVAAALNCRNDLHMGIEHELIAQFISGDGKVHLIWCWPHLKMNLEI